MKIALIADVHFGYPGRLPDILWAMRHIKSVCLSEGVSKAFVLGDLFHDRERIDVETLNTAVDFFVEAEADGLQFAVFPGNHDMYLLDSWDITAVKPLGRYIEVYNKPTAVSIGNLRAFIVPFMHYEDKYMAFIKALESKRSDGDLLFTHIGIRSATVYAGHFHVHQQVGSNVWYVGSPIPFRFDEGDAPHGFMILDTESRQHRFIDIMGEEGAPPQFVTIDDSTIDKHLRDSSLRGNMVRVSLSKDYTHNQLEEIRHAILESGARGVRWLNLVSSKEQKDSIIAAGKAAASAAELFERFIEADKSSKDLSRKLLLKLNAEIVADGDRKYSLMVDQHA